MTWLEHHAKSLELNRSMKHTSRSDAKPKPERRSNPQPILAVQGVKPQVTFRDQRERSPARKLIIKGRSSAQQQRRELGRARSPSPHPEHRSRSPSPAYNRKTPGQWTMSPRTTTKTCAACQSTAHLIQHCPEFTAYSVSARKDWIRSNNRCYNCLGNHPVKECTSKFTCSKCQRRHHTLIHTDPTVSHILMHSKLNRTATTDDGERGIYPTELVTPTNGQHQAIDLVRCLLDSGADQCFISSAAARRAGLSIIGKPRNFTVAGGRSTSSLGYVTIHLRTRFHAQAKEFRIIACVLSQLTSTTPLEPFDTDKWDHLKGLPLADPDYNNPDEIDILLGTSFVDKIMRGRKIEGEEGTPSAYLTEFGYVIQGSMTVPSEGCITHLNTTRTVQRELEENRLPHNSTKESRHIPPHQRPTDAPPDFHLQRFWETEEPPIQVPLTPMDEFCEDHYQTTTVRLPNGQYQIRWPFIAEPELLGSSYQMAHSRWLSMERRLATDPALSQDYHKQFEDLIQSGQLEPIPADEFYKRPHFWTPHHCVFKPSSTTTKMRIVFDASAKTSSGKSLNSILAPGPELQDSLFSHLLRFRFRAIAFTADIAKMYNQILVHPIDRDFSRVIYRRDPSGPVCHYRITSIPFGTTPAPYVAKRTLRQLAEDEKHNLPMASRVLKKALFMDDLIHSVDTARDAILLRRELITILVLAKMTLRKWSSNSPELLSTLPEDMRETQLPLNFDVTATVGTLGLTWHPATDNFQYKVTLTPRTVHTKRSVLSDISKIFDPLGLLAPIIVTAKIFMQKIWAHELGWDDALPDHLHEQWMQYSNTLPDVENIRIPRWLGFAYPPYDVAGKSTPSHAELHGFCDASENAFAAAIYLRTEHPDHGINVRLVASKSRVAPLKTSTIPRLELQGAVLLTELMVHLKKEYKMGGHSIYYWTDSTIVLHWLNSHPSKWKIFVAHRVAQI
ncbi:uncharacterized protein LOC110856534 [Folsomia candida]|uniref:uncharacterized protein LOC110856534 n=1 Tax=Folsomia candida TaxID=158441 RepID=UPI000B8FF8AB|nr:uncharacterized protein LOC110856534 [Folsomia candida]